MIWWLILAVAGPAVAVVDRGLFYVAERIDNAVQRLKAWRRWFAETDEAELDNLVEVLQETVPYEAEPWPTRQTPTDMAEAYKPATLREALMLQRPEPIAVAEIVEPVRTEVDREGCNVPCTAKHCEEHGGVLGTVAQRRHSRAEEQRLAHLAWTTDTAEWSVSLLGLSVPDFPEVRSPIYLEAAT